MNIVDISLVLLKFVTIVDYFYPSLCGQMRVRYFLCKLLVRSEQYNSPAMCQCWRRVDQKVAVVQNTI